MTTETRTFVGETGTQVYEGWAGFIIGQTYALTYTQEGDEVLVQIPHAPSRERSGFCEVVPESLDRRINGLTRSVSDMGRYTLDRCR